MAENNLLEKIVSLCKRRGFVFPGSEIYGGLAGTYDYGPYGVELRNNIKQYFWDKFVNERDDVYGMGAAIFMHPKVWEASGHIENFADTMVECKTCHERFKSDDAEALKEHEEWHGSRKEKVSWTEPKKFKTLVSSTLGAIEGEETKVYLRGEITQGVHANFKNIIDSLHPKLPFGVAQIGKAFRNEIKPANFLYRLREFEQMELEWYIHPSDAESDKQFAYWKEESMRWYQELGIRKENLRFRDHMKNEMAHYARAAVDIEYNTPFGGFREAWGIHDRGDWDLSRHAKFSGADLSYVDENGEHIVPRVIETSGGIDRAFLYVMIDAYTEDEMGGEPRTYLKLSPKLAPVKVAVFPLLKNKPELVAKAREVYDLLRTTNYELRTIFDDNGNIGKRYRRQDEIGTPFCITIDFQTLDDNTVTLRDRDSGKQERIPVTELTSKIKESL